MEYDEMNQCELCGGELVSLGKLGSRLAWRCRACGVEYMVGLCGNSWRVPPEPPHDAKGANS